MAVTVIFAVPGSRFVLTREDILGDTRPHLATVVSLDVAL